MVSILSNLFGSAQDDGAVQESTLAQLNITDLGEQINAGIGISVDDVEASEVTLVTMIPDDSGSIRFAKLADAVRQGHNIVLDALRGSKQADGILVHCRYLNGFVLYPFAPLDQAVAMDSKNYNPNLGTPLFDQTAVVLATVLAKAQEFQDNGVPCRTVTLLMSDGEEAHSVQQTAASVKALVTDLLKTENHIIAALGVGKEADFRKVFGEMGILDEWILTTAATESDIRRAMAIFSQSAIRASQGGAGFSQAALGGFAN